MFNIVFFYTSIEMSECVAYGTTGHSLDASDGEDSYEYMKSLEDDGEIYEDMQSGVDNVNFGEKYDDTKSGEDKIYEDMNMKSEDMAEYDDIVIVK